MQTRPLTDYDVAIIGAGPAGLSAAVTLGRARRRVIVLDHSKPRNAASHAVHCFLGHDGVSPWSLRATGRIEAASYGVEIRDQEVRAVSCEGDKSAPLTQFSVETAGGNFKVRSVLFATGMIDELPEVQGLRECYGTSVHHCPYCDGWEHRERRIGAMGPSGKATELALMLTSWSLKVTAFTNGERVSSEDKAKLKKNGVSLIEEPIARLSHANGLLSRIMLTSGEGVQCDALFFSSGQAQRSELPKLIGCECEDSGLMRTQKKQCTNIPGVYLAGDADGDVQFAVVAAAEGAIAATAVDQFLRKQDLGS